MFYQEKGFVFHGSTPSQAHCSPPSHSLSHWRAAAVKTEHKHRDLELFLPCLRVWSNILGFFSVPSALGWGAQLPPHPWAAPGTAHLRQGQGALNPCSLLKNILIKNPT